MTRKIHEPTARAAQPAGRHALPADARPHPNPDDQTVARTVQQTSAEYDALAEIAGTLVS